MRETEEFRKNLIADAIARARGDGRGDVAEYIALKASNDEIRAAASRLLFNSALEIAHELIGRGVNLKIENVDPHRFEMNKSFAVGSQISFGAGVRRLTLEAGWARTPNDGFMRGGALAYARLTHFGKTKHNAELMLLSSPEGVPQWFATTSAGTRNPFDDTSLRAHFAVLLD